MKSQLYRIETSKGYAPCDLLELRGIPKLAMSKLFKKQASYDPLMVRAFYKKYSKEIHNEVLKGSKESNGLLSQLIDRSKSVDSKLIEKLWLDSISLGISQIQTFEKVED